MKKNHKYPIVVIKERKEYWVYIPDLPGIYGRAKSSEGAKDDIKKALSVYIEDCVADGDKVPVSSAKVVDIDTLSIAIGR